MTIPPTKNTTQVEPIKRTVRFPPEMLDEITTAAARNGWSFNAEVVYRMNAHSMAAVMAELAAIKKMVQKVIDKD